MTGMMAWDIETTGFDPAIQVVTVASVYHSEHNHHIYTFATNLPCNQCSSTTCRHLKAVVKSKDFRQQREAFLRELDQAPVLAAFNGISFDIPFITTAFQVDRERVTGWVLKSVDIFEACKRASERTFGLNLLLGMNGFTFKTGSGGEAVVQARMGDWEELGNYCLADSRLTYQISTRPRIALPEGFKWRQQHGERTHDPSNVLFLVNGASGAISFEKGALEPVVDPME
jgi:hypothetical protein